MPDTLTLVPTPPAEVTPGTTIRVESITADHEIVASNRTVETITLASPGRYTYTVSGEDRPRFVRARSTLNVVA